MKRTVWCAFTFVATIVIGVFGTSLLTAVHQAAPTEDRSFSEKSSVSPSFDPLPLTTAVVNPRKIDSKQLSDRSMINSAVHNKREKVEVLARSITFPEVLNQGDLMISSEFPNATILCLNAALYAGRVTGLILAMDRDTVVEDRLYWTIDAAGDLFNSCLEIFLLEAFGGQNGNDRDQLKDVKEVLAEQIQIIQEALRYARNVKIKATGPIDGWSLKVPRNVPAPGSKPSQSVATSNVGSKVVASLGK